VDFPLGWEDFSAHSVGWELKSAGVERIAQTLRIDTGAILFVDDNAGELLEALQHVPRLRCLHAGQDADRAASCLRYFPSLWAFEGTIEDALRIADTRANEARDRALAVATDDVASYYRELGVRLTVGHDTARNSSQESLTCPARPTSSTSRCNGTARPSCAPCWPRSMAAVDRSARGPADGQRRDSHGRLGATRPQARRS